MQSDPYPDKRKAKKQSNAPGYCLLLFSMAIVGVIFASMFCIIGILLPVATLTSYETIRIPANSTDIYRVNLSNYGIVRVTIRGVGIAADGRPVDAFFYYSDSPYSGESSGTLHSGMLTIDDLPASNYFRLYATNHNGLAYAENHTYSSEFILLNNDVANPHITFQLTGTLLQGEFVITMQQNIVMDLLD